MKSLVENISIVFSKMRNHFVECNNEKIYESHFLIERKLDRVFNIQKIGLFLESFSILTTKL